MCKLNTLYRYALCHARPNSMSSCRKLFTRTINNPTTNIRGRNLTPPAQEPKSILSVFEREDHQDIIVIRTLWWAHSRRTSLQRLLKHIRMKTEGCKRLHNIPKMTLLCYCSVELIVPSKHIKGSPIANCNRAGSRNRTHAMAYEWSWEKWCYDVLPTWTTWFHSFARTR